METCYQCDAILVGRQIDHIYELQILILENFYHNIYGSEDKVKWKTTPLLCHKLLNSGAGSLNLRQKCWEDGHNNEAVLDGVVSVFR